MLLKENADEGLSVHPIVEEKMYGAYFDFPERYLLLIRSRNLLEHLHQVYLTTSVILSISLQLRSYSRVQLRKKPQKCKSLFF